MLVLVLAACAWTCHAGHRSFACMDLQSGVWLHVCMSVSLRTSCYYFAGGTDINYVLVRVVYYGTLPRYVIASHLITYRTTS